MRAKVSEGFATTLLQPWGGRPHAVISAMCQRQLNVQIFLLLNGIFQEPIKLSTIQ